MSWSIYPGGLISTEYRDVWRQANQRYTHSHPLLDSNFVAPLYKHFGGDNVFLAVKKESQDVIAMALLEKLGKGMWQLFLPSQAQIGPVIFGSGSSIDSSNPLGDLVRSLPGYAWLIGILNQDPDHPGIPVSPDSKHMERLEHVKTINLSIAGNFADYWQARDNSLTANTERRFRKLGREGFTHVLVELRDYRDMAAAVAEHGRLESTGWKEKLGTAIHPDNIQGRFYIEVLENFSKVDGARVYQLHFNNKVVASRLAIIQNQMLVFLKKTYDESFSTYAPGRMLDYKIFERFFTEKEIKKVEYYTNATTEDSKWSTGARHIYHINYYRSPLLKRATMTARKLRGASKKRISPEHPSPAT